MCLGQLLKAIRKLNSAFVSLVTELFLFTGKADVSMSPLDLFVCSLCGSCLFWWITFTFAVVSIHVGKLSSHFELNFLINTTDLSTCRHFDHLGIYFLALWST
ncbi:hypothetical protein ABZP36_022252 [Zizania latifolia]